MTPELTDDQSLKAVVLERVRQKWVLNKEIIE